MESEQGPNARRDYICKMSRLGKTLVGFFESWSTLANAGAEYMVLLVQLLPRGWCKHSARTCRHFSRLARFAPFCRRVVSRNYVNHATHKGATNDFAQK